MTPLIGTAFALFMGLMATRLFKLLKFNFPDVTAFLLAGLLVGPYFLGSLDIPWFGFQTFSEIDALSPVTSVALGFIAFSIGAEFRMSEIKEIGKAAVVIGIFQALAATLLVDAALIGLHFILGEDVLPIPACITLGAIASATAPAATLMVVRQYKAKGPVTSLLLPIVALDDAVGLILFAVSFGIAQALEGGSLSVISIIVNPLLEIVCSLLLGTVMGLLLSGLEKLFFSNSNRLAMTISIVFMTIAFSSVSFPAGPVEISFSSLLTCMMAGTVFCNASEYSKDIFERCDKWTVPLYACFFVLSGAELDLAVFRYPSMILVGVTYILVRCIGKYYGARLSSTAVHCSENVKKYLGITLFPQAGVALGMVVTAQTLGQPSGSIIRNVILFSVLVYELVGPSMTRWALTKAGDITVKPAEKTTRRRFQRA
ncbi:MAG: cation:proton antiporter [Lachnospiraceae bacterium]|nr:cation:proton antiporter [Lachnospiraceae bacterium]